VTPPPCKSWTIRAFLKFRANPNTEVTSNMTLPLQFAGLFAALALTPAILAGADTNVPAAGASFSVAITVDAARTVGEMTPIWRFFGADEPNYAYMTDGKKLLSELGQLDEGRVYFRAHHLLTSGDGAYALKWGSTSAYKEDADGRPVYDWSINDRIFDTYLERRIRPYVEIGFMPEALTTHPQNYPHHPPVDRRAPADAGQSYPPKEYGKWGDLVFQWTRHCVEKYGAPEVRQWYWEVWNEPNISYWHGSHADYFKLYDYAVDGVRRGLADARVGGPETAGGPELRQRPHGFTLGLCLLPCQRGAGLHQRPRPHGYGQPVQEHERRLCRHRGVSRVQKAAHRHRRIRSRRLRRLPRTARRLPERNHVFQLHGGEFFARV
jgi:hypothetical protein